MTTAIKTQTKTAIVTVHIRYSDAPKPECISVGSEYTLELYVNSSTGDSYYNLNPNMPKVQQDNANNMHYQEQGRWIVKASKTHYAKVDKKLVYDGLNVTIERVSA